MAVEQRIRMRADRLRGWGIGLVVCASLFWIYAAWQVFTPYDSTYNAVDCPAPVNSDRRDLYFEDAEHAHRNTLRCAATRDWPRPLAALVISVPLSATGAALLTAGTVITRLRHHDDELQRAKK
ncbi:hypothetical protein [Streptomyces sp. NPDC014006]|uniref:hypothetical protein n=1 Tax=Streptomyces sp. NPDC014006 TaxID=3364870 RepID=UPI0036F7BDB3